MAKRAGSILQTVVLAATVVAGVWWGRWSVAQQQTNDMATITGFSIPEVDDTGELKWKVLGDYARFNPHGGPADITRLRMEMYKGTNVDMVLTSPQCLYDREKREAETEAPVQITGKDLFVTGNGFFWSGTNNLLVIRRDARVVLKNSKSFVKPSTNDVTQTNPVQEKAK